MTMTEERLYSLGKKEYSNRRFLITGISVQRKEPGKTVSYDTTHSAFIFPLHGEAQISFGTASFQAACGTIIHGAPGYRVTFRVDSDQLFEHLNIYYDAETPWHGVSNIMQSPYAIAFPPREEMQGLLHRLQDSVMRANWDDQFQRNILAQQLILSSFGVVTKSQDSASLERAVKLIQSSYRENLKLKDLAEEAGMTEAHFSYIFHKNYHIRPVDYLIRFRLRKAAELLAAGSTVSEAAWSVGYQDPLYFSRLYKKHFGTPPSRARQV